MRLAMRALVLFALPGLVFGWLASARVLPGAPDLTGALGPEPGSVLLAVLAGGAALLVLTHVGLAVAELVRGPRAVPASALSILRPVAIPAAVLTALAIVAARTASGAFEPGAVWLGAAATAATLFACLLLLLVLAGAIVGVWARRTDLWPGRRAVTLALLVAALAATPVEYFAASQDVFNLPKTSIVPLAEAVRLHLTDPRGDLRWSYEVHGSGLL
jgi:hypothetical protein